MTREPRKPLLVGIDTGGTFTDLVAVVDGALRVHKVPSTPADPSEAVLRGLGELLGGRRPDVFTYSSTVATNALLERKGARVALVTNERFEDLIEIGRQNRSELYALSPGRPEPLVPRALRFGIAERTLYDGRVERRPTAAALARLRARLARAGVDAVAICLLHAYANPAGERAVARALGRLGVPLSVSSALLPEYREVERLSTTVINAYVAPRMGGHLARLERRVRARRFRVMQSDGTAIRAAEAGAGPMRTILSGPAAGVVGAAGLAASLGVSRFITFDMGGTSTDVSLFDGEPQRRTLSAPAGYPLRTPVIDIHTVGAGGGSIARVDAGGSLKVGPESSGADPGPACYGKGEEPTVTDANLVAGRLVPGSFLGGRMRLDAARAGRVLARLGRGMGASAEDAALGVIRVVVSNMERAIRVITVERGFDPRELALLAFGGAGPMHAAELARSLGIRHVILPRHPGLLCATGALAAPVGRERSLTIRILDPDYETLVRRARPLIDETRRDLVREGVAAGAIGYALAADLRSAGEAYEIEVPLRRSFREDFHAAHRRLFGHSAAGDVALELVNLRVRATAAAPPFRAPRLRPGRARPHARQRVRVAGGGTVEAPVYARDGLGSGARLRGPALLVEMSSTAWIPPGFGVRVDAGGNVHLEE